MWHRRNVLSIRQLTVLVVLTAASVLAGCCHNRKDLQIAGGVRVESAAQYTAVGPVRAGQTYTLAAEGKWVDWFVCTDAKGFTSRALMRISERKRRHPDANWFALVGLITIDDRPPQDDGSGLTRTFDLSPFLDGRPWKAPADGILQVFANDVPNFYWNNRGAVILRLETQQEAQ